MEKRKKNMFTKFFMLFAIVGLLSCGNQKSPGEDLEVLVSTVSHPEWSKNAVLYEVNVRQFTPEGTFNAFAEHLPRLREMGIDILWFMPVTPIGVTERKGTLGSYYSVQNYTAINPEFGTFEDFTNMVGKAHELGMHVIVDWVANHTAWDHPWTETNPDFYYHDAEGNNTPPYDTDWSDVIQLDYENKALWAAMIGEMKFWLEEANIDGFRCDVAYLVPTEFWNEARLELEKVKPIFMLAEADHPHLNEHAFNAGYSWTSHHAMNSIAKGEENVAALDRYFFEENMGNYPVGAYKILFIDNHDENSWAGTVADRLGDAKEAMAVLTSTASGMPLLYNGQEAGLDKMLEFFEKDQIHWGNLEYEEFFKTLFTLKKENKALWNGLAGGPMVRVNTNNDEQVFAFTRQKENDKVFVVLNLSDESKNIQFLTEAIAGSYTELFSTEAIDIDADTVMTVEEWGYRVFVK